jgi:DNA topoisomerase-3
MFLAVRHQVGEQSVSFEWGRHRVFDHQICVVLCEMMVDNPMATVTSVRAQQRSRFRPVGLTTTEMQKIASRRFRMSPADALATAEKLYQRGLLSYPRTETECYAPSIDLAALVQEQTGHPTWGAFAASLLPPNGAPTPRNGRNSDEAHPPIHPTKLALPDTLENRERQIYELVTRSFLACCSRDAKGQETVVSIDIAGETVIREDAQAQCAYSLFPFLKFTAKGMMITDRGFLEVYLFDTWSNKVSARKPAFLLHHHEFFHVLLLGLSLSFSEHRPFPRSPRAPSSSQPRSRSVEL